LNWFPGESAGTTEKSAIRPRRRWATLSDWGRFRIQFLATWVYGWNLPLGVSVAPWGENCPIEVKFAPQGWTLSSRGEIGPQGWRSPVSPSIPFTRRVWVNISPWRQSSPPLGAKLTPRGKLHPYGRD
jgi:hypothetical protein